LKTLPADERDVLLSRENLTSIVEVNDWDGAVTVLESRAELHSDPARTTSFLSET